MGARHSSLAASRRLLYSEMGCEQVNPDFTADVYSMGSFLGHPATYKTMKVAIPVIVEMSKPEASYIMSRSYLHENCPEVSTS